MRAAIYETFGGEITIKEVPIPSCKEDGVIVKVMATGMCLSDWHGWKGHDDDIKLPHVPGHELSGIIHEVGPKVRRFQVGDRITVPFVCACGSCPQCDCGHHQVCDNQSQPGFTHWGSYAEYVSIDYADVNIVKLPSDISFVTAASLGCRFTTAYRALVHQAQVKPGEVVAIYGCGGVGLSCIMIAASMGAIPVAIDVSESTLSLASELGAQHTIHARKVSSVVSAVREWSEGGVSVSVDALGSQETCFNSVASLSKRGRHIQVGLMVADASKSIVPMDLVVSRELEIYGSHGMQAHEFPSMLRQIDAGILNPDKLIEKRVSLEEAVDILPQLDTLERKGIWVVDKF